MRDAAQDTLAAVSTVTAASAGPAAGVVDGSSTQDGGAAGMDATWARLSDGLLSGRPAGAQAWLLQLLVAAAQRQQQEAPGVFELSAFSNNKSACGAAGVPMCSWQPS